MCSCHFARRARRCFCPTSTDMLCASLGCSGSDCVHARCIGPRCIAQGCIGPDCRKGVCIGHGCISKGYVGPDCDPGGRERCKGINCQISIGCLGGDFARDRSPFITAHFRVTILDILNQDGTCSICIDGPDMVRNIGYSCRSYSYS